MYSKATIFLFVTVLASAITILLSGMAFWESMTDAYLPRFVSQYSNYFLLFAFSALFAKLLGDTGAAQSIAYKLSRLAKKCHGHEKVAAVLCIALIQAVLTYGGISLFVVSYTVVLIGKSLFEELNVPWKLYVCSSIGSSSFTAAMLPGTPQLTNIVPTTYFGTTTTAAPVLGLICSAFVIALSVMWVFFQVGRCERAGEGFYPTGAGIVEALKGKELEVDELPLWQCVVPSIFLLIVLNGTSAGTTMSLVYTCIFTYIWFMLFPATRTKLNMTEAARGAVTNCNQSIAALASAAGFGGVVAATPGFQLILNSLDAIPGGPLVEIIVSINLVAGFCGSSSSGLSTALPILSERFLSYGIPPQALHRLCSIASVGLDSLPHSSAVANNYYIQRISYKDGYINNFMFSVVFTLMTAVLCAFLISIGITF